MSAPSTCESPLQWSGTTSNNTQHGIGCTTVAGKGCCLHSVGLPWYRDVGRRPRDTHALETAHEGEQFGRCNVAQEEDFVNRVDWLKCNKACIAASIHIRSAGLISVLLGLLCRHAFATLKACLRHVTQQLSDPGCH